MRTQARFGLVILFAIALAAVWFVLSASKDNDSPVEIVTSSLPNSESRVRSEADARGEQGDRKFDVRTAGTVVDPLGLAAAGATIQVWTPDESAESERRCRSTAPPIRFVATADDQGAFVLEWPEEEQYCVRAKHDDWSNSEPMLVSTGENAAKSLRLELQPLLQVRGRVVDSGGLPVVGADLALMRRDGPANDVNVRASVDDTGHFQFSRLNSGDYELKSVDSRYAISQPAEIVLRMHSIQDLLVRADALTAITGRVLDPKGKPLANVRILARSAYDPNLALGNALSRDDGSFTLYSEPLSEAARMAQRMSKGFVIDKSGNERRDAHVRPSALCIGFEHRSLQADPIHIIDPDATRDVGTIYLRAATILSGLILVRDRPVAARLRFRPTLPQTLHPRQGSCVEFPMMREVQSAHDGTFGVQLASGHYEVDVAQRDAPPRSTEIQVGENQNHLRLTIQ